MRINVFVILMLSLSTSFSQSGFEIVNNAFSGIDFSNDIEEDESVNIMMYDYLYNGGGIGIGDFDHNGYMDLFFSGNMVDDKLYFNQGDMKFKDVTEASGITQNGWSTGVCVLDINNDGWDDIYVCRSGWFEDPELRRNKLYVNLGNGAFEEQSAKYGLDLEGHHMQAASLDFDLDGDLDLYVMGHPKDFAKQVNIQQLIADIRAGKIESDMLLENDNGEFKDVTKAKRIVEYGFGLGLAITDINQDGYPDIIVANDYDEPDHVFINQKGSYFIDRNLQYFKHTSNYSMGNDVGDINNDGLLDYICVDMAFATHERSKTNMPSMNPQKFFARVQLGWNYQYMHNMLQLNTGLGVFQEISQYAGVAKTDWSWAPLLFDADMDGYNDLFISNGYKRDTKFNDLALLLEKEKEKKGSLTIHDFLAIIPSVKVPNQFYRNNGDYTFEDQQNQWGFGLPVNSNGAAYVDLDNDGDLDLVTNNVDTLATIFRNDITRAGNFICLDFSKLKFQDYLGWKVSLKTKSGIQSKECYRIRGFQSSVDPRMYFYWAKNDPIEYLQIEKSNGKKYRKVISELNGTISLDKELLNSFQEVPATEIIYDYLVLKTGSKHGISAGHQENDFNDFEKEVLLPHRMSQQGPPIAVGDFNGDNLEDFIVGASSNNIPIVYLQNQEGYFSKTLVPAFYNHQKSEDESIVVLDANNDGHQDLFITSGGYEYLSGDSSLVNRLYVGDGTGQFGLVVNAVPSDFENSGKVIKHDIDKDGDLDLLVCGRVESQHYPFPGKTSILLNHKGFFKNVTEQIAPDLAQVGMVNDACFMDVNNDGLDDIIVIGEWMKPELFLMNGKQYIKAELDVDKARTGWWTAISCNDIDGDGDLDLIVGNAGMNNKFNASSHHELDVYANDFDDNGTMDIVLSKKRKEKLLPVRGKECSTSQMPFVSQKFPSFVDFANADLRDIYPEGKLKEALHYQANEFRSGIYKNNAGKFEFEPFPAEAQFSFLTDFEVIDLNGDGLLDILAVGNRYGSEVETTRYDSNCGITLIQNSDGSFRYLQPGVSGFFIYGDSRNITSIKIGQKESQGFLVGVNNGMVELFEMNQ